VGTLIAYATGPGKVASDGYDSRNGLFTEELVKAIQEPGLSIEEVFKRVTKAVRIKSDNAQVPWVTSSLEGDFSFSPVEVVVTTTPPLPNKPGIVHSSEAPKVVVKENEKESAEPKSNKKEQIWMMPVPSL
jgi:hypothetical protein